MCDLNRTHSSVILDWSTRPWKDHYLFCKVIADSILDPGILVLPKFFIVYIVKCHAVTLNCCQAQI